MGTAPASAREALDMAYCRPPNPQVKSGQRSIRTFGATLRSPRQQPRSSQSSIGQDNVSCNAEGCECQA